MKTDLLDIRNCDCMELMAEYPDKHFDLAIVDPPYGIGESFANFESRGTSSAKWKIGKPTIYKKSEWDKAPPSHEYFEMLFRVSKDQIIWGANYFMDKIMRASSSWIVWDKERTGDFADVELAYSSHNRSAKLWRGLWNGFQRCEKTTRIHPTQKPVKLYSWLLQNYAQPGQRILDTHLGSGSIAIACHYYGAHLTASELDTDYYNAACERIERETRQLTFL